MARQLSTDEIDTLLVFSKNAALHNDPKIKPAFSKEQTLAIIDAVSDQKTMSNDYRFNIKYLNDGERFSVYPVEPFKHTPCGNFTTKDVLQRLSL